MPAKSKQKRSEPREVIRVVDSRELILSWVEEERKAHLEVREQKNGNWSVYYPEDGWIPCESDCKLRHTHSITRPMSKVNAEFTTPEEAYEAAQGYAGQREIRVIPREDQKPKTMVVSCDRCAARFDSLTNGASFTIVPYDKRRKQFNKVGLLCDDCADWFPSKTS